MIARLWWKETRTFWPAWPILFGAGAGLQWVLLASGSEGIRSGILMPIALCWATSMRSWRPRRHSPGSARRGPSVCSTPCPSIAGSSGWARPRSSWPRRSSWPSSCSPWATRVRPEACGAVPRRVAFLGHSARSCSRRSPGACSGRRSAEPADRGRSWPSFASAKSRTSPAKGRDRVRHGFGDPRPVGDGDAGPGGVGRRHRLATPRGVVVAPAPGSGRGRHVGRSREADPAATGLVPKGPDVEGEARGPPGLARRLGGRLWHRGLAAPGQRPRDRCGPAGGPPRGRGGLVAGVGVFGGETAVESHRFLLHLGVGPGPIWSRTMRAWGNGLAITGLVILAMLSFRWPGWWDGRVLWMLFAQPLRTRRFHSSPRSRTPSRSGCWPGWYSGAGSPRA